MSILNEINNIVNDVEVIEGTGEKLSDLILTSNKWKERPWNMHKTSSQKLHDIYSQALEIDPSCITPPAYNALENCASWLLFSLDGNNNKKLKVANFCKARLCPMCNWRKSLKLYSQMLKITNTLLDRTPNSRFIFVTFTVKNCTGEDLNKTLDKMNMAFKTLIDKRLKKKLSGKFVENLQGYMRAIEVTYNQDTNEYHPHIHALFVVKPSYFSGHGYVKKDDWQKIWGDCLGVDYDPVVHVQTVKVKKEVIADTVEEKKIALQCAISETAKYPVKISDINSVDTVIKFSHALRGRRLVTFGGVLAKIRKELKLEDVETGDLVHVEDEDKPNTEVAQVLYLWRGQFGAYIC